MKIFKLFLIAFLIAWMPNWTHAQDYPLEVSITARPNFTPVLGEFLDNPSQYINVRIKGGSTQQEVYLLLKMEQIAPAGDINIASKAIWRPAEPIMIQPMGMTVINQGQMMRNFSGASVNDFNITGVNLEDYKDYATASTRIPEGTYRVCLYACDFNEPLGSVRPLSDPNGGCTIIRICYKSAPPQWIRPIHYSMDSGFGIDKDNKIEPKANIRFQWTAPVSNCSGKIANNRIIYQFKLTQLLDGQTVADAISNNPPVIIEDNLLMTHYNLDTIKNPNLLQRGKQYVTQVTAQNSNKSATIDNDGKSKVILFKYGSRPTVSEQPETTEEDDNGKQKSDTTIADATTSDTTSSKTTSSDTTSTEKDPLEMVQLTPTAVDCDVELPTDKKPIKELKEGEEVKIGKFTMRISKITSSSKSKFSGEGSIKAKLWESKIYTINAFNVKVKFKDIQINTNKEVFAGSATGIFKNNDFGLDAEFTNDNKFFAKGYNFVKEKLGGTIKDGVKKANVDKIGNFIGSAKAASASFAEIPQTLPLGLKISDDITEEHGFNIAVSDMFFTPKGAMFSLIFMMHIPEAESYLVFGASDLCMYDNPFKNGRLALLADMEIPLGTKDYKLFVEGANTTKESVNTTYVKWTVDGFDGVQLAARLELPKDQIINVKDKTKPVSLNVSGSFQRWGDWMATISMGEKDDKFAFADLEDFEFTLKNATYDHSLSRSAPGFEEAIKSLGKDYSLSGSVEEFQGLFIKDIGVSMPEWISEKNSKVSFNIENAFYDEFGFNMNIAANNILDLKTGKLGGWGFSVNKIGIKIVQSSLREGFMNGRFIIPLASNETSGFIGYKAAMMKKSNQDHLSYEFVIKPEGEEGLNYNFLEYFKANLAKESNITVTIEDRGPKIEAKLNGKLSIYVEEYKAKITAVKFEGLRIANFNEKGKAGFNFNWGTWELGDGTKISDDKNKNSNNSNNNNNSFSDDNMFKTAQSFKISGFKAGIGKPDFDTETLDANQYKDVENVTKISLGLPIIMSLDKFGEDEEGKEMCAVRTKLKFEFPLGYNMPDLDKDYFGLEMPKIDYDEFKCELEDIAIRGEFGPVKMYGVAQLYNEDQVFGDGFRGSVKVEFPMGIRAYSTVQFGTTKEELDYWYVDGGASFGNMGLEVAGLFAINGFGGGVYKNMIKKGSVTYVSNNENKTANKPKEESDKDKEENEKKIQDMEDIENSNPDLMPAVNMATLGAGPSGVKYVPQKGGLGFYAQLDFCASNSQGGYKTFYGSGKLEMSFADGGFNAITINSNVSALNAKESEGLVTAKCTIMYNHPHKHFFLGAKADFDLGIEGGPKGSVPFLLDINHDDFYIALGEPVFPDKDGKNGRTIHLSLFDFDAGNDDIGVEGHMYLDAYILGGNAIPGKYNMPPPPHKVAEFLDMGYIASYRKNTASVKKKGFMMGAHFDSYFGFTFGPLYGDLELLAGIDVELIDYKGAKCSDGRSINGFNGYYCRGQAYAYLDGAVGVKLKLFGKNKKFELCGITAGAMVQAGFVEPSWFKGKAKVQGRILGGLIKFNTSAKFKVGEICEPPAADPLKELVIIESIEPAVEVEADSKGNFSSYKRKKAQEEAAKEKASVFTVPKIACNVEMNRYFKIVYEDGDRTITRDYVFKIEEFKYKCLETGEAVNCNNIINNKGEKFALRTNDMLRPNSTYEIDITVRAWEIINGYKRNPIDEKGEHYVSRKRQLFYFKTDALPNRIEKNNIITSYPIENQFETFPKENKYRVIMDAKVDYLFKDKNTGENFEQKELIGEYINLSNPSYPNIVFNYTYRNGGYGAKPNIEFNMHDNNKIRLRKGDIYQVRLYVPKNKEKDVEFKKKTENIQFGETAYSETDDENFGKQDNTQIRKRNKNKNVNININNTSNKPISKQEAFNQHNNFNAIIGSRSKGNNSSNLLYQYRNNSSNFLYHNNNNNNNIQKHISDSHSAKGSNPYYWFNKGKGKAKSIIKDYSTGKTDSYQEDMNKKVQASLDKLQQILDDKGKRMDFELIYKNHFRVSNYNSLKEKFRNIRTFAENEFFGISYLDNNIKDKNGNTIYSLDDIETIDDLKTFYRSFGAVTDKGVFIIFPPYTTREEIYNYYAYNKINTSSRAEEQPSMVQFEAMIKRTGDKNHIINKWDKMKPILNEMANYSSEFSLPLTDYKGSDYNREFNIFDTYIAFLSDGPEKFQGPLTDYEISNGRISREKIGNLHLNYYYKNTRIYFFANQNAAIFSDFLIWKKLHKNKSDKVYFRTNFTTGFQSWNNVDNEYGKGLIILKGHQIHYLSKNLWKKHRNLVKEYRKFWLSGDKQNECKDEYRYLKLGEHDIQYYFVKPENYYQLYEGQNLENYWDKDSNNRIKVDIKNSDDF